ncbi:YidH family protein [Aestuariivirga sp.]|uniref:YidH family protein n=1 Tax=Aestuariivirga sp. TaxID=2650926 RepID=UPI003BAC03EA
MSDDQETGETGRFTVRTVAETHFAWIRTRLAVERTIMAWVRTAVSLIAFGFTIVQFFDRLQQMPGTAPPQFPSAPRYLGLSLIFCGVASLVIALWEYRWTINYLWSADYAKIAGMKKEGRSSPIIAVILVLMLVGIFAFFTVLLRLI